MKKQTFAKDRAVRGRRAAVLFLLAALLTAPLFSGGCLLKKKRPDKPAAAGKNDK